MFLSDRSTTGKGFFIEFHFEYNSNSSSGIPTTRYPHNISIVTRHSIHNSTRTRPSSYYPHRTTPRDHYYNVTNDPGYNSTYRPVYYNGKTQITNKHKNKEKFINIHIFSNKMLWFHKYKFPQWHTNTQ